MSAARDRRHDGNGRTGAEWVVFAASAVVLVAVLGLVTWQWVAHRDPAIVSAEVTDVEQQGDRFLVSVDVHNNGDRAATDVGVSAELDVDGDITEVDGSVEFLAGGRAETIEFVFSDDPSSGELTVDVTSFRAS